MIEVETGIIKGQIGFDLAVWGETYSLGRRDFKDFDELKAPQLVIFNRENGGLGNNWAMLILADIAVSRGNLESLTEVPLDVNRTASYNSQGRLVNLTFENIKDGIVVEDGKIPLPPNELERVKSLIAAYRRELEEPLPGEPGFYKFIPFTPQN